MDLNGGGRINIVDLAIMAKAIGDGGVHLWLGLDRDGQITIREIALVARAFGQIYFEEALSESARLSTKRGTPQLAFQDFFSESYLHF